MLLLVSGIAILTEDYCEGSKELCTKKRALEISCRDKEWCSNNDLMHVITFCRKDIKCQEKQVTKLEKEMKDTEKDLYE